MLCKEIRIMMGMTNRVFYYYYYCLTVQENVKEVEEILVGGRREIYL